MKPDIKKNADETLSEFVFRDLLARVHDGRLVAGAVVNEALLAEEYQVSRGPVREAVRRLQGLNLITREPYQRSRVLSLTPEFMNELFQVRMALEGMACNLAATRISDEEIDLIGEELETDRRLSAASANTDKDVRVFDFHERIVRACGNQRIVDALCGDAYHLLRIYRKRSGAVRERKSQAYQEHWQILRALKSRDPLLAESLMRSHIGRASSHLFGTESVGFVPGISA